MFSMHAATPVLEFTARPEGGYWLDIRFHGREIRLVHQGNIPVDPADVLRTLRDACKVFSVAQEWPAYARVTGLDMLRMDHFTRFADVRRVYQALALLFGDRFQQFLDSTD